MGELSQRRVVQRGADDGLGGFRHDDDGGGNRAQHHAGLGDPDAVKAQVHGAADDRDIHLRPRDETQIGVAAALAARGQCDARNHLALLQRGLARPGRDILNRNLAAARRAGNSHRGPGGNQPRHAVGGGGAVAEVADQRRAALNLGGADKLHPLDHAGPVRDQRGVRPKFGPRNRDADLPAAVLRARHRLHAVDLFQVDQVVRRHHPGAQLYKNIRPPGQKPRHADRLRRQCRGSLEC